LQIAKADCFKVDGDAKKAVWRKIKEIVFRDAVTGKTIEKNQAKAKMLWSDEGLFLLWIVEDGHIWGTYRKDDDPIYKEEVVEIFIGAGKDVPKDYFEFQFSPLGVKFDAKISNPTGSRHDKEFEVDVGWNCEGLKFVQKTISRRHPELPPATPERSDGGRGDSGSIHTESILLAGRWITEAFIPWQSIGVKSVKSGDIFRANLFRIDGYPKQNSFQAWQPTFQDPPNFHVPEKFGYIESVK